jgi:hypothetical protein
MDDLFSAMLVLALSSVMLVTGQQYLSKKPEITAAASRSTDRTLPQIARQHSCANAFS